MRFLLVVMCFGHPWSTDVVGRGVATARTMGYARSLALTEANDDGVRQCHEADEQKACWQGDSNLKDFCVALRGGDWECHREECGHCKACE